MSGSGPSGDETPTIGGGQNSPNCSILSGRGTIMSPAPAVLPSLKVNDLLDVSLRGVTGPLQAYTQAGQLVGGIFLLANLSASFIACINDNFEYQAKIVSLTGGLCEILISIK